MIRTGVAFTKKILPVSVVAFLLLCAPLQLGAEERMAPAAGRTIVLDWLAGVWGELTAWVAGEVVAPSAVSGEMADGSCAIDPNGCPHGG